MENEGQHTVELFNQEPIFQKKIFLSMLKPGDMIEDLFIVTQKKTANKKNGEPFISFTLTDKTGNMNAVLWDNADQINKTVSLGQFVRVAGKVSQYEGSSQLIISRIMAVDPEKVSPKDFIPSTNRNPDSMMERLQKLTRSIQTPYLKELLEAFWSDPEFVSKFKTTPAAKKMHHNYLGGLLEHTLSMAILVERLAGHYSGIDMDMLLAGAVLHDIGKIKEIGYDFRIEYTDEGRLLNHIVLGVIMLEEKLNKIPQFPKEQAMLLKHLIVSHHGFREFGSPEIPKTIEAVLLNYIDEIDAKVNGIRDFIQTHPTDDTWSPYHKMMERQFFKGKPKTGTPNTQKPHVATEPKSDPTLS